MPTTAAFAIDNNSLAPIGITHNHNGRIKACVMSTYGAFEL